MKPRNVLQTPLRYVVRSFIVALLLTTSVAAPGEATLLTQDVPECRMASTALLPGKYLKLTKKDKTYAWLSKLRPGERQISGNGYERVDGSSMYDSLNFVMADLDNDGYCDWYITASTPLSSGGDRDSINTLYLGRKIGWLRIGAPVPSDKPDELGFGKTYDQQERYSFGEDLAIIHDHANNKNYFVTMFYARHERHSSMPGYRILTWDDSKKTLIALDKWQPGSKAAEVYDFFKQHGAYVPTEKSAAPADRSRQFDADVEAFEREQACRQDDAQQPPSDPDEQVSPTCRHTANADHRCPCLKNYG